MSIPTINDNYVHTHVIAFVWLSTFDNNSVKNDALRLEIVKDSLPINFIDGVIDDGKALVVSYGLDTSCIKQLHIGRVQYCSTLNHVDIVRNWQRVDISPSSRRPRHSFLGRNGRRPILFDAYGFSGSCFPDFKNIVWGPFERSESRFRSRLAIDLNKDISVVGIAVRALFEAVIGTTRSHAAK